MSSEKHVTEGQRLQVSSDEANEYAATGMKWETKVTKADCRLEEMRLKQ